MQININKKWKSFLKKELESENFLKLSDFLEKEYSQKEIFPNQKNIFNAFNKTDLKNLKVIIIGQDPYHTPNIAYGLSFSVKTGNKIPPSIKNIYKEIESDLKIKKDFKNADLENWAEQGILLLNQVLTVEAHKPGSHWKKGWENFTSSVIEKISFEKENIVFILWGKNAQEIEKFIKNKKTHLILKSAHPSPFSAHRGFFGSKTFSKTNKYLKLKNKKEIKW